MVLLLLLLLLLLGRVLSCGRGGDRGRRRLLLLLLLLLLRARGSGGTCWATNGVRRAIKSRCKHRRDAAAPRTGTPEPPRASPGWTCCALLRMLHSRRPPAPTTELSAAAMAAAAPSSTGSPFACVSGGHQDAAKQAGWRCPDFRSRLFDAVAHPSIYI
jgi:hypothetical protein